jgi:two-component system cell cycle response regulator
MKVLIVDPSSTVVFTLTTLFSTYGFECRTAADGQAALDILEYEPVEMLCFTYELPDMDGIEFLVAARARKVLRHQPCLMFAATEDKDVTFRALTAGVTECFSKQNLDRLEQFIERFAENNRRRILGSVLLVEDSASSAQYFRQVLERIGLHVDCCRNAEEAIKRFFEPEYDLVLVDYILDGVQSGLAVIRAIRESQGPKALTPILAISSFGDTARKVEILRSGANDFVSKPMVAEELEVRVHNLLNTQKLMRRLESQHTAMKHALEEIKTLKGILPICSYCKKIRDDSGYWSQLETYIHVHSGADFSHGVCPDCMTERLAELADMVPAKNLVKEGLL